MFAIVLSAEKPTTAPIKVGVLEGVSHFKPVAVELSATKSAILQEQSQRIVLGA